MGTETGRKRLKKELETYYGSRWEKPLVVADVGCGTNWFTTIQELISPEWDRCGIDLFPVSKTVQVQMTDPRVIPVPDNSMDLVVCVGTIEHCIDPAALVTECVRILKKGEMIFLSAPFQDAYHSSEKHRTVDYFRFTTKGLELLLHEAGAPPIVSFYIDIPERRAVDSFTIGKKPRG